MPVAREGISLSRKGILVTAFKPLRDHQGSILRLWEEAGTGGTCQVVLPGGSSFQRAYSCDLRNGLTDETGIEIVDNSFRFRLGAFQPASFILK